VVDKDTANWSLWTRHGGSVTETAGLGDSWLVSSETTLCSSLNEPNLESHYFPFNFCLVSSVVSPCVMSIWLDFLHITLFRVSVPVHKYERGQAKKMRIYEAYGATLSVLLLLYWIYGKITYGD
jgi:hypothetical protein